MKILFCNILAFVKILKTSEIFIQVLKKQSLITFKSINYQVRYREDPMTIVRRRLPVDRLIRFWFIHAIAFEIGRKFIQIKLVIESLII